MVSITETHLFPNWHDRNLVAKKMILKLTRIFCVCQIDLPDLTRSEKLAESAADNCCHNLEPKGSNEGENCEIAGNRKYLGK